MFSAETPTYVPSKAFVGFADGGGDCALQSQRQSAETTIMFPFTGLLAECGSLCHQRSAERQHLIVPKADAVARSGANN
jgi:hypothetical protein